MWSSLYSGSSSQSPRSKISVFLAEDRKRLSVPRGDVEGGGTVRCSESNAGSVSRSSLRLGK